MSLSDIARRIERLAVDNSPVILTAIGITGTITTALFSGRASFKAAQIIASEEYTLDEDLEFKEKVKLTWKLYIPAVGTGVLAVSCIIFANRIGMRRAAAIATAYSLSEKAFGEYKGKVIERLGQEKEKKVRDELAQERVDRNPISSREVIITGTGDVLCYDSITGRYFKSNVEKIRRAQNEINAQILNETYACLNDFYNLIGLPGTRYANEVGWNVDNRLSLLFSTVLSEDEQPCLSMEYAVFPVRGYYKLQ